MEQGHHSADRELPFEPQPDIDQDRRQRPAHGKERRLDQFARDLGPHRFDRGEFDVRRHALQGSFDGFDGVDGFDVAVGKFGDRLGLAEVNSTGEFTHAEDVEAVRNEFVFDGGGVGQGRVAGSGAEIGEETEVLPEWKKCAALGLDVGRKIFPLGAADGAEEDGIGLFAGCDGVLWERSLVVGGVEGGAANEVVAVGDLEIEFCCGGFEDFQGNIHDFGANAVAGENRDRMGHGRGIAGNDGIENRKD